MSFFFTSDFHSGHNNILHLCNRKFKNMDDMMNTIITNHNAMVTDSDITYDLGDVAYKCHPNVVVELLNQLNGKRIIIWGNHDKPLNEALKKGMLKDLIKSGKLELIGDPYPCQPVYTTEINGQIIVMCHYSLRTWPHAFRRSWLLFGHSHSKLPMFYKSMDVGVDTNNFKPYSFAQIKNIMDSVVNSFSEGLQK